MIKTLVLFENEYELTKKIAEEVSLILGPAKHMSLSEAEHQTHNYDVIVICVSTDSERLIKNALEFVSQNANWLKGKKVAVLCTCLSEKDAEQYMKQISHILGNSLVFNTAVVSVPFNNEKFIESILELKIIKEQCGTSANEEELKKHFENFIIAHNTCSLTTGFGSRVRATPIEYTYLDGSLYVLSEGGEKFANILLNPKVSVGIFDDYKNMNQLGGMQLTGSAEITEIGSEEYRSILTMKNLKYAQIIALPIALNMIKIKIIKAEFLWSGFRELNFDTKQVLFFQ